MKKQTLYFIIIALLLLNIYTLSKVNRVKRQLENSFQQSDFTVNSLRNEINNIYSNVDVKLKKQASILDNHNLSFGELNPSNLTVPVTLSITPKEYERGLTASVQLNDKLIPMKSEGTSFVATVDAYIFNQVQLKVLLDANGVQKIETIEEYIDLKNKYILDISGGISGTSSYSSNQYQYNGEIKVNVSSTQSNNSKKITIVKDVNGTIVGEETVEALNYASIPLKEKITLNNGDKFTLYAIVEDEYELKYKYIIEAFEIDDKGEPIHGNYEFEGRKLAEIRDKKGNLLYDPRAEFVK